MEKSKLIRRDRVMEMLGGVSVSTLYRFMADGTLPRPIKLSKRVAVWVEKEVQEAIEKMVASPERREARN